MILSGHQLIFLHLQKTGGNSISELLLPFSNDSKTVRKHQDGKDRFGLNGPATKRKHAVLSDYHDTLGSDINHYRVAITTRDPFQRAISMYFSPHQWFAPKQGEWVRQEPYWDINRFETLVTNMLTLTDFLSVNGSVQLPDYVIRYEHLALDVRHFLESAGIPAISSKLPHINQSAAHQAMKDTALNDPRAKEMSDSIFAADQRLISRLADTGHAGSRVA